MPIRESSQRLFKTNIKADNEEKRNQADETGLNQKLDMQIISGRAHYSKYTNLFDPPVRLRDSLVDVVCPGYQYNKNRHRKQ